MSAQTECPDGCLALESVWFMLCLLELERSHALRHKPALHSFILGVVDRDQVFPRTHLVMGCSLIFGKDLFVLKGSIGCITGLIQWLVASGSLRNTMSHFVHSRIYIMSIIRSYCKTCIPWMQLKMLWIIVPAKCVNVHIMCNQTADCKNKNQSATSKLELSASSCHFCVQYASENKWICHVKC